MAIKFPTLQSYLPLMGILGRAHGALWNGYLHVDVDKQRLFVDAIMGRLTAEGVHRNELNGESLRRKNQKYRRYISNCYKRYIYPAIGINETVVYNLWCASGHFQFNISFLQR